MIYKSKREVSFIITGSIPVLTTKNKHVKVYNDIPLGESDPNKSSEVKKLEHELICLMNSWRPDKKRIKEIKKQLKQLNPK